jgi:hypothetical protein
MAKAPTAPILDKIKKLARRINKQSSGNTEKKTK